MTELEAPLGYKILDNDSVCDELAKNLNIAERLGGSKDSWKTSEVGDGNLNQVFIVEGEQTSLVVKQALPYLRLVGESWPLPLSRAYFESMALASQNSITPGLVPEVLHYDEAMYCIVMEYLHPHIIMRKGMIAGTVYEKFADTITTFMANNLFYTSDLAVPAGTKRLEVGKYCGNHVLCKITEDVIFTEPYMEHANNRWTSPQLDGYAKRWREDDDLHVAINKLKYKFLNETQALLHGDLHTGSIMVTETDTRVIDPEFAFYGPMGFDVGKIIANFLISYFSQTGHEENKGARDDYRVWILETTVKLWDDFYKKFLELWQEENEIGDAFVQDMFVDENQFETQRKEFMDRIFADAVLFCGACLTRRILGIAHNIDYEHIEDTQVRGMCEARGLELSHQLLTKPGNFKSIGDIVEKAKELEKQDFELAS